MIATLALPFVFAVALWFTSTGLIVWLDRLPRHTYPWSLGAASLVAIGVVPALIVSAEDASAAAAYLGFAGALALWGWHEMAFLFGIVTGPRTTPLPDGTRGFARFWLASQTLIWHELALVATGASLWLATADTANPIAAKAFTLLYVLRLASKLNIFLGVRNLGEEVLPKHLDYLRSYYRRRACNVLWPVTIAFAAWLATGFAQAAYAAPAGSAESAAAGLLFTLALLGIVEHLILVAPISEAAMWRWAMPANSVATRT